MITESGKVVPSNRPIYRSTHQPIQVLNGVTGANCGVCGKFTPLYHEARINTGSVFYREIHGGKFIGTKWIESIKKVSFPEIIRRWVCSDHYRQVTFTSPITSKQIVMVEPIFPVSREIVGLKTDIESIGDRMESQRVRAQERILASPLNDPNYQPPAPRILTQAEHKRKWDEWW